MQSRAVSIVFWLCLIGLPIGHGACGRVGFQLGSAGEGDAGARDSASSGVGAGELDAGVGPNTAPEAGSSPIDGRNPEGGAADRAMSLPTVTGVGSDASALRDTAAARDGSAQGSDQGCGGGSGGGGSQGPGCPGVSVPDTRLADSPSGGAGGDASAGLGAPRIDTGPQTIDGAGGPGMDAPADAGIDAADPPDAALDAAAPDAAFDGAAPTDADFDAPVPDAAVPDAAASPDAPSLDTPQFDIAVDAAVDTAIDAAIDAGVDAAPQDAMPDSPVANSVRVLHGQAVLGSGQSSIDTPIAGGPVDPTKAFLVFGFAVDGNRPDEAIVSGAIAGPSTLHFERLATLGSISISWHVVEAASGIRVQRGSSAISSTLLTVPIQTVDRTRSFALVSSRSPGGTFGDTDVVEGTLPTDTTLDLARFGGGGTTTVEWQVVELTGASVQAGKRAIAANQTIADVTLPKATDPTRSWLVFSHLAQNSNNANMAEKLFSGLQTAPGNLRFERGANGGTADVSWFLVEFSAGTQVVQESLTFTSPELTQTRTIPSVTVGKTFVAAGFTGQSGLTTYQVTDNPGHGWFRYDLTGPTTLVVTRGKTGAVGKSSHCIVDLTGWQP